MASTAADSAAAADTTAAAAAVATTATNPAADPHHPIVRVVASYPLLCADDASLASLDGPVVRLGPFDQLVQPFIPIAVVYVYRQPRNDTATELLHLPRLRRALTLLLDSYPHLTGRLQPDPRDHSHGIAQLGSGAKLFEATCSATLDEFCPPPGAAADARLQVTALPGGGNDLLAPFDPSLNAVYHGPILTVQHTRFACGSVALGVRLLHGVCDSDGFLQLVRDLAELYRSLYTSESAGGTPATGGTGVARGTVAVHLAQAPHIRSFLAESHTMPPEELQAALQFTPAMLRLTPLPAGHASEAETQTKSATAEPDVHPPRPAEAPTGALSMRPVVVGRVLRFSADELRALKAHANAPTDGGGGSWVSTFDALSAHLYQRVYAARVKHALVSGCGGGGAPTSHCSTSFLTPVNWRSAARLNLPPRYFANALICACFTLPPAMLADAPLARIAEAVHGGVRSLSTQQALDTLRWVAAQPDKRRIQLGIPLDGGTFMVSQWCKMETYVGADFDVDARGAAVPPLLVAPPFTPISLIDGLGYLVATEQQLSLPGKEQTANRRTAADNSVAGDRAVSFSTANKSAACNSAVRSSSADVSATGSSSAGDGAIDVHLALSEPLWPLLDMDPLFRRFQASSH